MWRLRRYLSLSERSRLARASRTLYAVWLHNDASLACATSLQVHPWVTQPAMVCALRSSGRWDCVALAWELEHRGHASVLELGVCCQTHRVDLVSESGSPEAIQEAVRHFDQRGANLTRWAEFYSNCICGALRSRLTDREVLDLMVHSCWSFPTAMVWYPIVESVAVVATFERGLEMGLCVFEVRNDRAEEPESLGRFYAAVGQQAIRRENPTMAAWAGARLRADPIRAQGAGELRALRVLPSERAYELMSTEQKRAVHAFMGR